MKRRISFFWLKLVVPMVVLIAVPDSLAIIEIQRGAGSFVLTKTGEVRALIVKPANHTAAETMAAERFQHYIEKISGARLPIVVETYVDKDVGHLRVIPGSRRKPSVYIGRTMAAAGILSQLAKRNAPAEASMVQVGDGAIVIAGIDDVGTLHAVYFVLEELGCRWYMPGEWGTVVPKHENLAIPAGSAYRAPDFEVRFGGEEPENSYLWGHFESRYRPHLGRARMGARQPFVGARNALRSAQLRLSCSPEPFD